MKSIFWEFLPEVETKDKINESIVWYKYMFVISDISLYKFCDLNFIHCSLGYKPFLHFIRKQIQVLGKLAEQTPPTLQLSTSVMNDESSDSEQLSPVLQTIHTKNPDSSPELSPTQPRDPTKASECAISWVTTLKNSDVVSNGWNTAFFKSF